MKVRDVIRMLRQDGWTLVRTKGSHRQYRHSQKLGLVTVPGQNGKELHASILCSVLRQAQLSREALQAAARKAPISRGDRKG